MNTKEQIMIMNEVKKINNLKFVIEDTHLYWNIKEDNYIDFQYLQKGSASLSE